VFLLFITEVDFGDKKKQKHYQEFIKLRSVNCIYKNYTALHYYSIF